MIASGQYRPTRKHKVNIFSIVQDAFDTADPISMKDACNNEPTSLPSLPVAQWSERPTGVMKVMRSITVGDSDFSDFSVPR